MTPGSQGEPQASDLTLALFYPLHTPQTPQFSFITGMFDVYFESPEGTDGEFYSTGQML